MEHNQRVILNEAAAVTVLQKQSRVAAVCGQEFIDNAIKIETDSHTYHLQGWINLPQYSRSQADMPPLSRLSRAG